MFTSLELHNYKSLVELNVSFLKKKDIAKKLIVVYGENERKEEINETM